GQAGQTPDGVRAMQASIAATLEPRSSARHDLGCRIETGRRLGKADDAFPGIQRGRRRGCIRYGGIAQLAVARLLRGRRVRLRSARARQYAQAREESDAPECRVRAKHGCASAK